MKADIRRWGRRCLWVLTVVLALTITVQGVDLLWYRSHVPVRFQNANWEGRWETRRYGGLSGRLLVRLPEPLPKGVDFQADSPGLLPSLQRLAHRPVREDGVHGPSPGRFTHVGRWDDQRDTLGRWHAETQERRGQPGRGVRRAP